MRSISRSRAWMNPPVAEVERFEIYADSVKVVKQRYPAAGAKNALVQLFTADLEKPDAPAVQMDLGADTRYLSCARELVSGWQLRSPCSGRAAIRKRSRCCGRMRGRARRVSCSRRRATRWVEINDDLVLLEQSPRFIWESRRSGNRHLYLYGNDGKLIRPLTEGNWDVVAEGERAIRGVDERGARVYFMANKESPLERQLYYTPLNEGTRELNRVTQSSGWHAVTMSKDCEGVPRYVLDAGSAAVVNAALGERGVAVAARGERSEG